MQEYGAGVGWGRRSEWVGGAERVGGTEQVGGPEGVGGSALVGAPKWVELSVCGATQREMLESEMGSEIKE